MLIDLNFRQIVLVLTVIVVLIFQIVLFFVQRTVYTSRFVDSVIDTGVSYTFATAVVEPSVTGSTHTLTRRLTFVPGVTLSYKRDGTVDRHHVRFQRMHLFVGSFWKKYRVSSKRKIKEEDCYKVFGINI